MKRHYTYEEREKILEHEFRKINSDCNIPEEVIKFLGTLKFEELEAFTKAVKEISEGTSFSHLDLVQNNPLIFYKEIK